MWSQIQAECASISPLNMPTSYHVSCKHILISFIFMIIIKSSRPILSLLDCTASKNTTNLWRAPGLYLCYRRLWIPESDWHSGEDVGSFHLMRPVAGSSRFTPVVPAMALSILWHLEAMAPLIILKRFLTQAIITSTTAHCRKHRNRETTPV